MKYNLERHKNMKGSNRRGELAVVSSIDAVDPTTVRINLEAPFAPLLAVLTDRSGMMVSPKAAEAAGEKFGAKPVCSGPFRFVERIARIASWWNGSRTTGTRADPLRAHRLPADRRCDRASRQLALGQLDFIERVAPSDPNLRNDSRFKIAKIVEIGYQGITINVGKSDLAQKNPLGRDPRVREAFELSLDRDAIVKVAMEGEAQAGNQWVAPSNRFYGKALRCRSATSSARSSSSRSGVPNPSFTLMTPTTSDAQRIAQIVQAMAKEAGFDIKIQSTEFATSLNLADKGQFEAYVLAWSGRADPDGNLHTMLAARVRRTTPACKDDVEKLITESRTSLDATRRAAAYDKIAQQVQKDRPIIYLFHRHWLWAHTAKLSGLRTVPDGMVRVQG